jgi:DNA-directed RNA polymerase subunit H (RpoH/RPB5)
VNATYTEKCVVLILSIFIASIVARDVSYGGSPNKSSAKAVATPKRTQIKVPTHVRAKMKDLSAVLQMVKLTPLVNDAEEVVGVELNEIAEKDITQVLKAQNGDVVKEVRVFRKSRGKIESTTYPITSASDVMGMYSALVDASSVQVDLKRGKQILPMTYILED